MNVLRLRAGELVAGVGGILLLVALALDWARPEPSVRTAPGVELSRPLRTVADQVTSAFVSRYAESGFSTLGVVLVLMLLIAAGGALALVALTVTERDTPVLPVATSVVLFGWTVITLLVLVVRLTIFQPGLELGFPDEAVDVLGAAWLGLAALVLIAAGTWLTLRDDRLESPLSAAPEVPVRPAPPRVPT